MSAPHFIPTQRGPHNPPPLSVYVEWRPESSPRCWFACWADGTVAAMCTSVRAAQVALGCVGNVKGASNG